MDVDGIGIGRSIWFCHWHWNASVDIDERQIAKAATSIEPLDLRGKFIVDSNAQIPSMLISSLR
jgi:hypothetical protein